MTTTQITRRQRSHQLAVGQTLIEGLMADLSDAEWAALCTPAGLGLVEDAEGVLGTCGRDAAGFVAWLDIDGLTVYSHETAQNAVLDVSVLDVAEVMARMAWRP